MNNARSLLAGPIPIAAIVLLLVNDHWAKAAYPGLVTGKLSDFAGMVFFPLLVIAIVELVIARPWRSRAVVLGVSAVCLCGFAIIELSDTAAAIYSVGLGHVQWLAFAVWATILGDPIPIVTPVSHTADAADLLAAIPGTAIAVAVGLAPSLGVQRVPHGASPVVEVRQRALARLR